MNSISNNGEVTSEKALDRSGTIYRSSGNIFIAKEVCRSIPHNFVNTSRRAISGFSVGSAGRMRRYLRECCAQYSTMVTLTYPGFYTSNGKQSKEHLRRFLQECQRYVVRNNMDAISYSSFWFLEFQDRGAPHYHILTTHNFPKAWIASTWYRIVNSEDERHLHAGTRIESIRSGRAGCISYVTKYANKAEQKITPEGYENVGRFWGIYGQRGTMSADTFVSRRQTELPSVETVKKSIFMLIQHGLYEGKVESYYRASGVFVAIVYDKDVGRKLRMRISQLSALTSFVPLIFSDAEIAI